MTGTGIFNIPNILLTPVAILIATLMSPSAIADPEKMDTAARAYGFSNTISLGVWAGDVQVDGEPYIYGIPIKVLDANSSEIDIQKCGEDAKLFEKIDGIFEFDAGSNIETISVENQKSMTLAKEGDYSNDREILKAKPISPRLMSEGLNFPQGSVRIDGLNISSFSNQRDLCAYKVNAISNDGIYRERDEIRISIYSDQAYLNISLFNLFLRPAGYTSKETEEIFVSLESVGTTIIGEERGPLLPVQGTVSVEQNDSKRYIANYHIEKWMGFEEQDLPTSIHVDIEFLE